MNFTKRNKSKRDFFVNTVLLMFIPQSFNLFDDKNSGMEILIICILFYLNTALHHRHRSSVLLANHFIIYCML